MPPKTLSCKRKSKLRQRKKRICWRRNGGKRRKLLLWRLRRLKPGLRLRQRLRRWRILRLNKRQLKVPSMTKMMTTVKNSQMMETRMVLQKLRPR